MQQTGDERRVRLRAVVERLRIRAVERRNRGLEWDAKLDELVAQELEADIARLEAEEIIASLGYTTEMNNIAGMLSSLGERRRQMGERLMAEEGQTPPRRDAQPSQERLSECFYCAERLRLGPDGRWNHVSGRRDHIALPADN